MFSDFPNLHPLVVHLPIVLLMLSAALQALLVYKDWPPVKWITMGVMAGGFLGAVAASTYFHAMPMGLAPRAAAVFAAHEQYAGYTLWLSGITLLLAGIGVFFKLQRRAYEILVLVSAVATAGVLSVAGHRGAQLVYVEGVGPQGRLVMKGHHHDEGGEAAMPGMEMGADTHDEKEGADDHHEEATPAAPGQPANPQQPASEQMQGMNMKGMEDMDMSGSAASQQPAKTNNQRKNSMSGMGNMDMSEKSGSGSQQNTPRRESMGDMPGMNMKKQPAKGMDDMKGMDMKAKSSPRAKQRMPAMPGMDMSQGTGKQPASAKKQHMKGMEGMSSMENMRGMTSGGKQPAGSDRGAMQGMPGMEKGQAMPGMGSMPGMSMPASPLDKFRFEDNNPGRNKSKNDKQ
jgi:uncharacterized membrane protein